MKLKPISVWIGRDDDGEYYVFTAEPEWKDELKEFMCEESATGRTNGSAAHLCGEAMTELLPFVLGPGALIEAELTFKV